MSLILGAISTEDCKRKLISILWILKDWFKWLNKKCSVGWVHSKELWRILMILYSSILIFRFHICLRFKIRSQLKLWRRNLLRKIRNQNQRRMNQFYQVLRLLQRVKIRKKIKKKNKKRLKKKRRLKLKKQRKKKKNKRKKKIKTKCHNLTKVLA